MNDYDMGSLAELQAATAPIDARLDERADAETHELRAAWQLLGRAIDAEQGGWDEAALVARLTAALPREREAVVSIHRQRAAASSWAWIVTGGLAGAMLLCASLVLQPGREPGKVTVVQPEQTDAALPPTWHDPLDEQIARAAGGLDALRLNWRDLDSSLTTLDEQMGDLARDLEGGSL